MENISAFFECIDIPKEENRKTEWQRPEIEILKNSEIKEGLGYGGDGYTQS